MERPEARADRPFISGCFAVGVAALALAGGCERDGEAAVRAVIARHDGAVREGDGEGYWALFSARARREAGLEGPGALGRALLVARPGRVRSIEHVLLRERTAAVFTRLVIDGEVHHGADRLVRESGDWRIDQQVMSDRPIEPAYFLPPDRGRFLAAGAPWEHVAPVIDPEAGRPDQPKASWQLARDESFVYLRASYAKALPPAGERLASGDVSLDQLGFGPANVEVVITRPGAKPVRVGVTFEAVAKSAVRFLPARTHVDTLDYTVAVGPSAGAADGWTGSLRGPQTLFEHQGHALVVRVPLTALGVGDDANVSLEFGPFGHRTRHSSRSF